jgi:hypothetical protein
LKLDNSVLEEFAIQLIHPEIISGLPDFELSVGPNTAFMSLSFMPAGIESTYVRFSVPTMIVGRVTPGVAALPQPAEPGSVPTSAVVPVSVGAGASTDVSSAVEVSSAIKPVSPVAVSSITAPVSSGVGSELASSEPEQPTTPRTSMQANARIAPSVSEPRAARHFVPPATSRLSGAAIGAFAILLRCVDGNPRSTST